MTTYEVSSLAAEVLVVIILIAEFIFDWQQVKKQARKIKNRAKVRDAYESLNVGESK